MPKQQDKASLSTGSYQGTTERELEEIFRIAYDKNWNNILFTRTGTISGPTDDFGPINNIRIPSEELLESFLSKLSRLENLRGIGLSGYHFNKLPPEVFKLIKLSYLFIFPFSFTELPPEIFKLTNLRDLRLKDGFLTNLPPEISHFTNLMRLQLKGNKIVALPPEIGQLANLRELSLPANRLSSLPPQIGRLKNLIELNLANNQLAKLPREIGGLKNLTNLHLGGNRLVNVPPEIGSLINLTDLQLYGNGLTTLPPEIGRLHDLSYLDLSGNRLTSLPSEMKQIKKLEIFNIDGNRFSVPPEILKKHKEPSAILTYLLEHGKRPLNEAKMILLGEGSVGKTSLVRRILENTFDDHELKTDGINISRCSVTSKRIPESQHRLLILISGTSADKKSCTPPTSSSLPSAVCISWCLIPA